MSKSVNYLQSLAFQAPPNATFRLSYAKRRGFFSLWGDNPLPQKEDFTSLDKFLAKAETLLMDPKLSYLQASAIDKYGDEIFNQTFNK